MGRANAMIVFTAVLAVDAQEVLGVIRTQPSSCGSSPSTSVLASPGNHGVNTSHRMSSLFFRPPLARG